MMGDIYATADRTIIHLGRPDNADGSVLRNLELYFGQLLVQDHDSSQAESLHEQAVKSILSRPWFRRVWILQELVLSKEPLVQYGTYRVSWEEFCRFLGLAKRHGRTPEISTYQLVNEMRDLRNRFQENRGEIRMIDILVSRRGLGVTDPRDMLYAHKGLASDGRNLDVDYSESCTGLYAEASFQGMINVSDHEILSLVDDGPAFSRLAGLPSWCPDWSQAQSISKLPRYCWAVDYAPQASPEYSPNPELAKKIFREHHALFKHRESRALTCLGIELAVVMHVSAPLSSKYIEYTKQEYFSSRLTSLRIVWRELDFEKSKFGSIRRHEVWGYVNFFDRKAISHFSQGSKQHIKNLRDLYIQIYTAWQLIVNNELIMPSLSSSTTRPEILDGEAENSFLSDERIYALGCWIFRDGGQTILLKEDGEHIENPGSPLHYPHYESTFDLLVQYFLPGFDRSIIDGRVLAETTLVKNSLFLCPATTVVADYMFNLLPMFYPESIRYFVVRNSPGKELWVKEIRDGINEKFHYFDKQAGFRRTLPRDLNIKDMPAMACTLVGEAYGTTNMYSRDHDLETPEWRRGQNETTIGHVILAIF
jgi:hypothetical protein